MKYMEIKWKLSWYNESKKWIINCEALFNYANISWNINSQTNCYIYNYLYYVFLSKLEVICVVSNSY